MLIATYGAQEWQDLAWSRAWPSAYDNSPSELLCFHDPEGTIASVRNELGRQAKSDWLLFLDADDEIAPRFLSAMARALEREPPGGRLLLTPAVQTVRKGGRAPTKPVFFDRGISLRDDNWLILGTLIERDLFLEVGGFSDYPHGFEDFSLWSKAWRAGAQVVKVPGAVYRYHYNNQSKHKQGWRDRKWQVATHERVVAELNEWEEAQKSAV